MRACRSGRWWRLPSDIYKLGYDDPREVAEEEAKTVGQNKKKGFRTLEIEGGNPPPHQVRPFTLDMVEYF
jgi:hypothetical protein